jgi:hypothetical protein
MLVRFYIDPQTGAPHVEEHGIAAEEVLEILRGPADHGPGRDGTQVAEGQTRGGRYLRVIYKENESDSSILVITAYDLGSKAKAAYRRRRRRRPR